jgi:hypothetical protein
LHSIDEDPAQVLARLAKLRGKVQASVKGKQGCTLVLQKYSGAQPSGSNKWSAQTGAEIVVDLKGADTVSARIALIDQCLLPLWKEVAAQQKPSKSSTGKSDRITVGQVVLGLDDLNAHRAPLWQATLGRLGEVSGTTDVAQWQPEDLHCHSDGTVQVVRRGIDGIEVALDAACVFVAPKKPEE